MQRASLLAFLLVPGLAAAEPITVWLQDQPPDERGVIRADKETGGTLHLWTLDLALPPEPEVPADSAAIEALATAVDEGKNRWDGFEIEIPVAKTVDDAVSAVTLLRTKRDREDLVRALMFEGGAVARAASASAFPTAKDLAPYRKKFGEVAVPRAWLDAYALMSSTPIRADLFDGTAWQDWQRFAPMITGLASGSITTDPDVGDVYLDGEAVEPGAHSVRPGRHWVHVLRGGVVSGRAIVDVEPGKSYDMPRRVSADEIARAVAAVEAGKRSDIPEHLTESLRGLIRAHDNDAAFLATMTGNDLSVLSMDASVILNDDKLVTVLVTADIGGGISMSTGFDQNTDGSSQLAPAASGGLGMELGVSYFALGVGLDGILSPGRTLPFSTNKDGPDNAVSGFLDPWLGLGAYALRPTKPGPTLSILATVGYRMPRNLAVGGRIAVGVPIDDGHNWVRILVGGAYGAVTFGDTKPVLDAYLRIGFAGRVDQ